MAKISLAILAALALANASNGADFKLTVGPPVAARPAAGAIKMVKEAVFVVRADQCEEPAKLELTATAEGLIDGKRRSEPVKVNRLQDTSIFSLLRSWPDDGTWLVALKAVCGKTIAGAIVPVVQFHFQREGIQLLDHAPSASEVEAALKREAAGAASR